MSDEEFYDIDEHQPRRGQYCEIEVVSYFKGWFLPESNNWQWLMDESLTPKTHVTGWKPAPQKEDYYEFIPRKDHLQ